MSLASELAALRSQQTASARAAGLGSLNRANTLLPAQLDPRVRPSAGRTRSRFDQARNTTRAAGVTLSDVINAQRDLQAAQERAQRAAGLTGGSSSIPRNIGLPQTIEGLGSFSGIPRDPTVLPAVFQQPGALQAAQERAQMAAGMTGGGMQTQGFGGYGFDPALVDYLNSQKQLSTRDAGISYTYDPGTQTFTGYTMAGPVTKTLAQIQAEAASRPPVMSGRGMPQPIQGLGSFPANLPPRDIGLGTPPPGFTGPRGELTQPFSGVTMAPMPIGAGYMPQFNNRGLGLFANSLGVNNLPAIFQQPGALQAAQDRAQMAGQMQGATTGNPQVGLGMAGGPMGSYGQMLGQFANGLFGQQQNMGQFNNMNTNQRMGQSLGSIGSMGFGGQFNNMQPQMAMQQPQFSPQGPPPGFANSFSYAPL